ncbi:complement C1q tumor necrosis factor-related protein 3-like [Saccostrea cucullata]|uniref:complement C1q tumor necrosis factor-related protein 3-like n=1 Tax=Saccostrea cuccullata TaxID=36930 RepID=UPI002ED02A8F
MASKQGSKIRKRNGMRSTNGTVAFYAYLSLNLGNPGYLRVLVFDRPETNEGNGYSFHSGIFTAPRTGLYVFTWTIRSCNGNGYFQTDLLVNGLVSGKLFTNGYNYSQQYGSSTGMVVIHVGQGNQVYIRTGPSIISGTICSDTNGYSSFAGWSID